VKIATTKAPNFVGMVKVVVMFVEGAVPLVVAAVVSAVGFVVEDSTRAQ
jgi:ABC-type proline/glycine betaine transport system permease subunit